MELESPAHSYNLHVNWVPGGPGISPNLSSNTWGYRGRGVCGHEDGGRTCTSAIFSCPALLKLVPIVETSLPVLKIHLIF